MTNLSDLFETAPAASGPVNFVPVSRDLTRWIQSGTPVLSFDQDGIDGSPNSATLVEDNSTSVEYIIFGVGGVKDTETNAACFYVKKDANNTVFPEFHLRSNSNLTASGDGLALQINTSTGASAARINTGSNGNWTVAAYNDDWWKVTMDAPNTNDNYIIVGVFPAASASLGGALSSAQQRSVIMDNVELYLTAAEADIPDDPNYNL